MKELWAMVMSGSSRTWNDRENRTVFTKRSIMINKWHWRLIRRIEHESRFVATDQLLWILSLVCCTARAEGKDEGLSLCSFLLILSSVEAFLMGNATLDALYWLTKDNNIQRSEKCSKLWTWTFTDAAFTSLVQTLFSSLSLFVTILKWAKDSNERTPLPT